MEFKKPLTKLLIYVRTKALEAGNAIASAMQSNAGYDMKKELGKGFFEFHRVYYRSRLVREYLARSRIGLKFLPPYAPNLNLIERLWRFMNKKIKNNKYYEKFDEFKNSVKSFFSNISLFASEMKCLLVKNFHIIGEGS